MFRIRRLLLDGNQIDMIRELPAQCIIPPMDYPIKRVDEQSWQQAASLASWPAFSVDAALTNGIGLNRHDHKKARFASVMDYYNAYMAKDTSPLIVMKLTVAKTVEWAQEGYPVFSTFNETDILHQAAESANRYDSGQPLSVFDGVPVAFKDLVSIAGHVTLNGKNHKLDWGQKNTFDDDLVYRFRHLGAIIFGATIMTEGGMSPLGYNAHYKGPYNAYSVSHFSGGSSSGSAVAVSSGLVPVAIGFDSGGSIRVPSAWSGLHGLAPTFGRVPLQSEIYMTMIKAGPLASSAVDAALAYSAMVSTPSDSKMSFYGLLYGGGNRGPPHPHLSRIEDISDFSDIRIGVYPDWINDATPEVKQLTNEAIDFFVTRGATIVEIDIPHLRWLGLVHGIKISTEYALEWDLLYHTRFNDLDSNTRYFSDIWLAFSVFKF